MQEKIVEVIRRVIPDDGQHIWGLADLSGLLHERFKGFNFGISIGRKLDNDIINAIAGGPTLAYWKHYSDTNVYLAGLVTDIADKLNTLGVNSLAILPTSSRVDRSPVYASTLRHDFSHKMVGTRAGLGWIGKSDLFISTRFGPRLRLASILVGNPLRPLQPPIDSSRCGKCHVCVEACPAHAITGKPWDIRTDRDQYYDAFKCQAKALELTRAAIGQDEHEICGICISVCPVGKTGTIVEAGNVR